MVAAPTNEHSLCQSKVSLFVCPPLLLLPWWWRVPYDVCMIISANTASGWAWCWQETNFIILHEKSTLHKHLELVVKNLPANARNTRDVRSIPGSGRSPGGGHGNPWTEEPVLPIGPRWCLCLPRAPSMSAAPSSWTSKFSLFVSAWSTHVEEEMATHSRILAWRIPGPEEPGGLQPMGSQRVGHGWATKHEKHIWTSESPPYLPLWQRERIKTLDTIT